MEFQECNSDIENGNLSGHVIFSWILVKTCISNEIISKGVLNQLLNKKQGSKPKLFLTRNFYSDIYVNSYVVEKRKFKRLLELCIQWENRKKKYKKTWSGMRNSSLSTKT